MGFGIDTVVIEELHELIAMFGLLRFDDVEMEHVAITRKFGGQSEILRPFQTGGVTRGPFAPQIVPGIDVLEFGAEDAGVQVIEPAVEPEAVDVARIEPMIEQLADNDVDLYDEGKQRAYDEVFAEVLLDNEAGG